MLVGKLLLHVSIQMITHAVSDFLEVDDTIVFGPGSVEGDTMCIDIEIINDVMIEITEQFLVNAASTSPSVVFSPGSNQATVSIIDDDGNKLYFTL